MNWATILYILLFSITYLISVLGDYYIPTLCKLLHISVLLLNIFGAVCIGIIVNIGKLEWISVFPGLLTMMDNDIYTLHYIPGWTAESWRVKHILRKYLPLVSEIPSEYPFLLVQIFGLSVSSSTVL